MDNCQDCGQKATHVYINAYGVARHKPVCEADANYYRAQGVEVIKVGK